MVRIKSAESLSLIRAGWSERGGAVDALTIIYARGFIAARWESGLCTDSSLINTPA
jgi:hypothetical protein